MSRMVGNSDPTFSLHKLRVFREVAERQSATLAAKALFVSQPVVSNHIRDLEQYFGAQLFDRSGRQMILTESGRTVLSYSNELARRTAETQAMVRLQGSGAAGRILVGASETPGCYRLPEWLADFRLHHPAADITMDVTGADEICDQVRAGELDFAVVAPIRPPHDLAVEVLFEERLVIVCSPRYPLARRLETDPVAIDQVEFVTHSGRPADWLDGRLRQFGIQKPQVGLSVGTTEAVKLAVRTGAGVAAMFHCSVEGELCRGDFVEVNLTHSRPRRPFYLVHVGAKRFSPIQSLLFRYVRTRGRAQNRGRKSRRVPSP